MQFVPGSHAIPYDADVATKMDLLIRQIAQSQHTSPPTVKVLATQQLGPHSYLISVDVNPVDGTRPFRAWTQVIQSPLAPTGAYSLTLYQVMLPQTLSPEQGNLAVKALLGGYRPNSQVITAEMGADRARSDQTVAEFQRRTAQNQAITDNYMATSQRQFDIQQRNFAADDYALLGNTVVRDRDYNEHGLVGDNLAEALTEADPNRFQEVPPSQYVRGVDY
jgi:hypothetical protein